GVGLGEPGGRVDRAHRRLDEPHPRLVNAPVLVAYGVRVCAAEHDVELRVAEDEALGLIDEHDLDLVAELHRQTAGHFETAKTGAEHHDSRHTSDGTDRPPAARSDVSYGMDFTSSPGTRPGCLLCTSS